MKNTSLTTQGALATCAERWVRNRKYGFGNSSEDTEAENAHKNLKYNFLRKLRAEFTISKFTCYLQQHMILSMYNEISNLNIWLCKDTLATVKLHRLTTTARHL